MLQRSIQSVQEVDWNGCWNVACTASWSCLLWMLCCYVASRASSKLIQMDVTTKIPERPGSWLKWMLERSMHSVLELLVMDVMLLRSIQSVFEVDSNGCYNENSSVWSCLKAIFQHNTWKWLSEVEKIISRLWNYCAYMGRLWLGGLVYVCLHIYK